jgi:ribosomal protein S24E
MEIEIVKETKMPLLGRKQVELNVENLKQPTPSKAELLKAISAKLKADEANITIKRVSQKYGSNQSNVIVNIYNSPELQKKFEVYNKKPKKRAATERQ